MPAAALSLIEALPHQEAIRTAASLGKERLSLCEGNPVKAGQHVHRSPSCPWGCPRLAAGHRVSESPGRCPVGQKFPETHRAVVSAEQLQQLLAQESPSHRHQPGLTEEAVGDPDCQGPSACRGAVAWTDVMNAPALQRDPPIPGAASVQSPAVEIQPWGPPGAPWRMARMDSRSRLMFSPICSRPNRLPGASSQLEERTP